MSLISPAMMKSYHVVKLVLPVSVKISSNTYNIESSRTTFLYVKEHHAKTAAIEMDEPNPEPSSSSKKKKKKKPKKIKPAPNKSLFIANLPKSFHVSTSSSSSSPSQLNFDLKSTMKLVFSKILESSGDNNSNNSNNKNDDDDDEVDVPLVENVTISSAINNTTTDNTVTSAHHLSLHEILSYVGCADEAIQSNAPNVSSVVAYPSTTSDVNFGYLSFTTPAHLRSFVKCAEKNSKKKGAKPLEVTVDADDLNVLQEMGRKLSSTTATTTAAAADITKLTKNEAVAKLLSVHLENIPTSKELQSSADDVMARYEERENAQNALNTSARAMNTSLPDADGFVTVSYKNTNKSHHNREIEGMKNGESGSGGGNDNNNNNNAQRRRGKANKRSRSTKKTDQNAGLSDFYRFQVKDSKKRSLDEMRDKFERDKERVAKMKMQRGSYKQF